LLGNIAGADGTCVADFQIFFKYLRTFLPVVSFLPWFESFDGGRVNISINKQIMHASEVIWD
jgi:hypothetical protein